MLENKNIVIIGGTSGMGLSAAKAFIQQGARVVAVGRNEQTCLQAQDELGHQARVIAADATQEDTAPKAIGRCIREWGSFDGLYHVAGGSGRKMGDGPLHKMTLDGWNKTMELNLSSLMLSNKAAVRMFMKTKNGGTILNMSSVLGYSPAPHYFSTHAYAAAKAAVIGFSKSLAAYYAKDNIRINVIAPALVETPMARRAASDAAILDYIRTKQPLAGGRIGNPGDLDGAACFFMSDHSAFTTGQLLAVDGGWGISEGQLNRGPL